MSNIALGNIFVVTLMLAQPLVALFFRQYSPMIFDALPGVNNTVIILVANQLCSLFLPTMVFAFFYCKKKGVSMTKLLSIRPLSGKSIILIVMMSLVVQPLLSLMSLVAVMFFENDISEFAFALNEQLDFLPMIALIALMPAVFEELAMRGFLLSVFKGGLSVRRVLLINGLFFGMLHLNGQQFLYAAALGSLFAYFVMKTGSIFAGMIAHFTINSTQVILLTSLMRMLNNPAYKEALEAGTAQNIESGISPEILTAANYVTFFFTMLSLLLIVFIAFAIFVSLLKKFQKENEGVDLYGITGLADDGCRYEEDFNGGNSVETLKYAIVRSKSLSLSFYLSLLLAVLTYFTIMLILGLNPMQFLFLASLFVSFFFSFFLLRVRS